MMPDEWASLGLTGLVSFGVAWVVTPKLRTLALRHGICDRPDGRLKTQAVPVAYLGGVAVYLGLLVSCATLPWSEQLLGVAAVATAVGLLGLLDDLRPMTAHFKLAIQTVLFVLAVRLGVVELPESHSVALEVAVIVWLIGATNALNLVDVSDGLAGSLAVVASLCFLVIGIWQQDLLVACLAVALAGGVGGFLRFNVGAATMYLGDAGSTLIGFVLAWLAVTTALGAGAPVGWRSVGSIVVLAPALMEVVLVMAARIARGESPIRGSRDHFAVRLKLHGWQAPRILSVATLAAAFSGGLGVAISLGEPLDPAILSLLAVAVSSASVIGVWARFPLSEGTPPEIPTADRTYPAVEGSGEEELRSGDLGSTP